MCTVFRRAGVLLFALLSAAAVAGENDDLAPYRQAKALYESALASEDCGEIDRARTVLAGLHSSREAIPPAVSDELGAGRAELGIYARRARRELNGRWAERCRAPRPDCAAPPPVTPEAIDNLHELAGLTAGCPAIRDVAERMIGTADASVAAHTLDLLLELQRAHPECFP